MAIDDNFPRYYRRGTNNGRIQPEDVEKIMEAINLNLAQEKNSDILVYLKSTLRHASICATIMYMDEFNKKNSGES